MSWFDDWKTRFTQERDRLAKEAAKEAAKSAAKKTATEVMERAEAAVDGVLSNLEQAVFGATGSGEEGAPEPEPDDDRVASESALDRLRARMGGGDNEDQTAEADAVIREATSSEASSSDAEKPRGLGGLLDGMLTDLEHRVFGEDGPPSDAGPPAEPQPAPPAPAAERPAPPAPPQPASERLALTPEQLAAEAELLGLPSSAPIASSATPTYRARTASERIRDASLRAHDVVTPSVSASADRARRIADAVAESRRRRRERRPNVQQIHEARTGREDRALAELEALKARMRGEVPPTETSSGEPPEPSAPGTGAVKKTL